MLEHQTRTLLRRNADLAVRLVAAQCGGEHLGKGAYYRLFMLPSKEDGIAGLVELDCGWAGGRSNIGKIEKYRVLSFEKAVRLALNAQVHGHIASAQSTNEKWHQYRGSALVQATVPKIGSTLLISSVSGLPVDADERAGLFAIDLMNWSAGHGIVNVLVLTDNLAAYRLLMK